MGSMHFRREFLAAMAGAAAVEAAILPRTAPEFVLALPDGAPFKLSQLRGKIAAVSFISTG